MAFTNHTTNYELPQYVGTDKPSYLNDYNYAMATIDGQMKTNANGVSANSSNIGTMSSLTTTEKTNLVGAINEINSSVGNVGNLSNLTTTEKSSVVGAINEVNGNVGTLSSLYTTEKSSVVGAINEVDTDLGTTNSKIGTLANLDTSSKSDLVSAVNEVYNKTNLSTHLTFDKDTTGVSATGCTFRGGDINVSMNSDKSVFKIYASIYVNNTTTTSPYITLPAGTFATSSADYDINPTGFSITESNPAVTSNTYVTIKQNGSAEIHLSYAPTGSTIYLYLFPCVYFAGDFGD